MRNKLIISAFALFLSFSVLAQKGFGYDQDTKISVYPNPAIEYLMIQIDSDKLSAAEFELNSMIGNRLTIKPEEMGYGKYKIQVKDLATGYYFLIVKDEESRFRQAIKFLKN